MERILAIGAREWGWRRRLWSAGPAMNGMQIPGNSCMCHLSGDGDANMAGGLPLLGSKAGGRTETSRTPDVGG